jgi:hypothetical protein
MPQYKAPINDMQFVLHEWLNLSAHYQKLGLEDYDQSLVNEVLNQGAKFAEEVIAPLNREGDEQGCTLTNGVVTTPEAVLIMKDKTYLTLSLYPCKKCSVRPILVGGSQVY